MRRGKTLLLVSLLLVTSGLFSQKEKLFRAAIQIDSAAQSEIPFIIGVVNQKLVIHNGEEKIEITDVTYNGDSVNFKMPVFDSEFKTRLREEFWNGIWKNNARKEKNILPYYAEPFYKTRFANADISGTKKINGTYEITFSNGTKEETPAIGIFKTNGYTVTGTVLTETGDYRYLEGNFLTDGRLALSCFDGSHAFLFIMQVENEKITGTFYSGSHWKEPFAGVLNPNAKLKDPEQISVLKDPAAKAELSFLNTEGKTISLADDRYKEKVIIIQIMGSWCPNCKDETAYLSDLYKRKQKSGLEIIAVAFEKTDDIKKARELVNGIKNHYQAGYEFLVTGLSGKEMAAKTFPMLSGIYAFPTTIFIDKRGKIRKVHSGFSGPATGIHYTKFCEDTERFIDFLQSEK